MIRVHIFHTGKVRVDTAVPYKEKNPLASLGVFRGEKHKTELPVSCYLIEHPDGKILIDTGWHSKYATKKPKRFCGILNKVSAPLICKGESVDCRLAELGLKPADIDSVYFRHLDFDHTSGMQLLEGVGNVFASREEIADAKKYPLRYVKDTWKGFEPTPFDFCNTGIGPVGKSFDVFGDGSVVLVNTPGHSHGHCSAVISNGFKYVLLAGDAIYTQKSIREKRLPGFTVDNALAEKSLEWMCKCASDQNCLLVAANHDPEIQPQTIEL